jgi:DNA-binding NtrC family response regulator
MSSTLQNGSATILLVEDEDFVREVAREVLSLSGYHVLEARTAAEALRIFRKRADEVGLLLTDVVLPGRSGRELSRELRAARAGIKTILISGYPDKEFAKGRVEEPELFYLPKPFSAETLVNTIREVLQESKGVLAGRQMAKRAAGSV